MPRYHYFDCVVDSDWVLPELRRAVGKASLQDAVLLRQSADPLAAEGAITWYVSPANSENTTDIGYGRVARGYVMRFDGLVDFVIDIDARAIFCHAADDCPATTLHHLLLDQALPRLVGQQGHIVLHASMACTGGSAIGFIGRSGWGKSTLAASFAADNANMSGDDALLLGRDGHGQPWCAPAYNGARLWSDSIAAVFAQRPETRGVSHYCDKQRVDRSPSAQAWNSRTPLRALFLLNNPHTAPSKEILITRVQGNQCLMAILQRCFLLDPHNMELSQRLWLEIGNFMRAGLPVYQLHYPRDFAALPSLRTRILDTLSAVDAQPFLVAN